MTVGDLLCLYDDETQWVNIMSFATLTVKQLYNGGNSYLLDKVVDYWFINKRSKNCEICIQTR